jgi:hypothetical protein
VGVSDPVSATSALDIVSGLDKGGVDAVLQVVIKITAKKNTIPAARLFRI